VECDDVSATAVTSKHERVVSLAVNVLLGFAIVLALGILIPALLGYDRFVINGHSMEPTIPYGSVAFDEAVPVDDLKVGDVITFTPPPEFSVSEPVTHRIVEIKEVDGKRQFRTKGDNNDLADPWTFTLDSSTQARVAFHVPYVGYIYIALSQWWVRFLVIVLPALGVAVWLGVILWREAGREVEAEKKRRGLSPRSTS
jgi:signal peptidase